MRFLGCLLLLFSCAVASASVPYLATDGYYYDHAGNAYTRTATWVAGYGCNAGYYNYSYVPYVRQTLNINSANFETEALRIARELDLAQQNSNKAAFDHQRKLEIIKILGLGNDRRITGYGLNAPYGSYNSNTQYGAIGGNGQSLSGYSAQQVITSYGDVNMNQLLQSYAQTVKNAQVLGGQATSEFGGIVSQTGDKAARIAEIFAKAEATRQFLKSLDTPKVEIRSNQNSYQVVPGQPQPNVGIGASNSRQAFLQHRQQACGVCHSGAKLQGGFSVDSYDQMSTEQKSAVWARLVTNDPAKRMPRNADGTPGAVTAEALKLWLEN